VDAYQEYIARRRVADALAATAHRPRRTARRGKVRRVEVAPVLKSEPRRKGLPWLYGLAWLAAFVAVFVTVSRVFLQDPEYANDTGLAIAASLGSVFYLPVPGGFITYALAECLDRG
jgi:hypothetical protein